MRKIIASLLAIVLGTVLIQASSYAVPYLTDTFTITWQQWEVSHYDDDDDWCEWSCDIDPSNDTRTYHYEVWLQTYIFHTPISQVGGKTKCTGDGNAYGNFFMTTSKHKSGEGVTRELGMYCVYDGDPHNENNEDSWGDNCD